MLSRIRKQALYCLWEQLRSFKGEVKTDMVNFKKLIVLFLAAVMAMEAGCAGKASTKVENKYTIEAKALVIPVDKVSSANNELSFKMLKETYKSYSDKNTVISPLSLSTIMALSQNSASGTTREEMLKALELSGIDDKTINEDYKNIIANFNSIKDINIKMANSIWFDKTITLKKEFSSIGQDCYEAEINSVDFGKSKTVNTINQWISDHTAGKIKKIGDHFDKDTVMALINTIYFKGDWFTPFESELTSKQSFKIGDGSTKEVDMMRNNLTLEYLKGDDFKAIRMPYVDQNFGMYIFLPDESSSVKELMKNMSADNWDKWSKEFNEDKVVVQIPKFHIEFDQELNEMLKSFGMESAFTEGADFSKASDSSKLYISKVLQKGYIDVGEKGTEAAAVTAVMMDGAAPMQEKPKEFIADRPFVYAIADKKTGYIIFIGVVENP